MASEGTVPGATWFVLFLGAVLTMSFTFFFGTQNVVTQSAMTGVLAALIFSAILVVIASGQDCSMTIFGKTLLRSRARAASAPAVRRAIVR